MKIMTLCHFSYPTSNKRLHHYKIISNLLLGSRKYFRLEHEMAEGDPNAFEDVSEKFKSNVWAHFSLNRHTETAKCHICSTLIKTTKGSTKGLHGHLKKHSIVVARYFEK